ncbi:MAG TPA: DUF2950 domain-containing protein [Candidatus Acidoferrum sp.]|nr:DUF2950 domain-containing protein [Candidatus Acidoferrum sp.]
MQWIKPKKFQWSRFSKLAAAAVLLASCLPARSAAQQKGQETFSSPEEASNALVAALQNNDEKALLQILGPAGKDVISSGDAVQDTENRENFVQRYLQMHRLVKEPNSMTTLYIGAENWPAPIPIVNKGKVWYFDTPAGENEILYRRIGRNEISAIRICQALVAAQKQYYSIEGGEYAQQTFSDEGKHNGLYWKVSEGEPQSPIGPLVAQANAEGYKKGEAGPPTPYRGYLFHVLTSQGKGAPGGAKNYIVDGKMTGGFAFVAYPAMYRSSGVMTFIVGADGVVLQKDLGKKTEEIGKAMKTYDPDSTWQKAQNEQEEAASDQETK